MARSINRKIRHEGDGVQIAADVNVTIAGNVRESNQSQRVKSRQRVVQRNGRTVVQEQRTEVSRNRVDEREGEPEGPRA